MHRWRRLQCASATQAGNRRTVNEFSLENLVYNINQIIIELFSNNNYQVCMCGRGGGAKYVVFFMNFTFRLWLARTWIRTFFSAFSFLEFFSSGNSFWKLTCVCCVYRTAFFVAVFLSIPCPALACGVRLSFGFASFPSFLVFRLLFSYGPLPFFRPYTRVRIL